MSMLKLFSFLFFFFSVILLGGCGGQERNGFNISDEQDQTSDSVPDPYSFSPVDGAELNELISSEPVTISGINTSTKVTIENGEYSISGREFTANPHYVKNGDSISVRTRSSAKFSDTVTATLTIGEVKSVFTVMTISQDTTPATFSFFNQTDVKPDTYIFSNPVIIEDINDATVASIDGGEFSVNDGDFSSESRTVVQNSSIVVRVKSAPTFATETHAILTVGGVNSEFSVATKIYTSDLLRAENLLINYSPKMSTTASPTINQNSQYALDLPINETLTLLAQGKIGFYCGGLANTFARVLQREGIEARVVDMVVEHNASHVTVLVEDEGKFFIFDPTFRIMLKNPESGNFVDIETALTLPAAQKRNIIYELPMPERIWLHLDQSSFLSSNTALASSTRNSNNMFFWIEQGDYVMTQRPSYNFGAYLYSIEPVLRERGLPIDYSAYVDLYKYRK